MSRTVYSANGRAGRIVFTATRDANEEIYAMDENGSNEVRLTNNAAIDFTPVLSPDGTRIAFGSTRSGTFDIWIMNADGSGQEQLTASSGFNMNPGWSPDGSKIVFESSRTGNQEIYTMNADGTNQVDISNTGALDYWPRWSPDGSRIAFSSDRSGNQDIWVMHADGSNPVQLTTDGAIDYTPAWSPDGSKIAFATERFGGVEQVMLMNADGTDQVRLTNTSSVDFYPAFSPDGTGILFSSTRSGGFQLYTMLLDGSSVVQLTTQAPHNYAADWGLAPAVNHQPQTSAGGPYTAIEGASVALALSANDADADPLSISWDLGDGTVGTGAPPATHVYANNGTYIVSITASDPSGATSSSQGSANISNAAPVLGASSITAGPVEIGSTVSVNASLSDAGVLDTHSATIDWGDGHTTTASVTENAGTGSISGSHAYSAPGAYPVVYTVTDNDGAATSGQGSTSVQATAPTSLWIGLKNNDDIGTYFDIRTELLRNGTTIGTGQINSVPGSSSNFNNIIQRAIDISLSEADTFGAGDVLAVRISVRIATGIVGHRSGTARLWFNDASASSRTRLFMNGSLQTFYLRSSQLLSSTAGTVSRLSSDVFVDKLVGGNPFKPFGTWQLTF